LPAPPRITVVTPSFNQARFLDETLRSVIAQRPFVHEYFVIDGGSTDGSVDIIRRRHAAGGIDLWLSEKDRGQADAIHKGFSRATGDYLYWLNSDDVLLPGAMETIQQSLAAHPEWDALTAYHVRIDEQSRIISMHRIPGESPAAARWGIHHVCQQTCVFRRELYEKVGGINHALHCVLDTELWCRMFAVGSVWGHVPQYLAAFRQHPQAKGKADKWYAMYRDEEMSLRHRFPQFCADTLKHRLGLLGYRAGQIFSGRHLRAGAQSRRNAGKSLQQVFGPLSPTPETGR
jgi:glycosyltransferase involved in cell wall biosynthesis